MAQTVRVTIANVTPEELAKHLASKGISATVFPSLGTSPDWENGEVEHGATAEIVLTVPGEALGLTQLTFRELMVEKGEDAVYVNGDISPRLWYRDGRSEDL